MDRSAALRVFSQFRLHLAEPRFRILEVQRSEYILAREWIARMVTPLRVLDAIHLAVAYSNGLSLITADAVLAEAAKHFGVRHKLIF